MKIQVKWSGHFLTQEAARHTAVNPPDDLAGQMPVEQRGLTWPRARLPLRRLRGEQVAHAGPVVERLRRGRLIQCHHPGLVRQHVPDRCRCGELWPVTLDRCVQVELAAVGEDQRADGREGLGDRVRLDQAVALPRSAGRVGLASPEVDDPGAVRPRRDGCARAILQSQHITERVTHGIKARVSQSIDSHQASMRRPLASGLLRARGGDAIGGPMPADCLDPRLLGSSGIEVSALSLGSWRTYERLPAETGIAIMRAASDEGITFFDDARYNDETGRARSRPGTPRWSSATCSAALACAGTRSSSPTSCGGNSGREQNAAAELRRIAGADGPGPRRPDLRRPARGGHERRRARRRRSAR